MQRILDGARLSLADVAPEIPTRLCDVIERSIAVDREARIQTAADLVEALAPVAPPPSVRRLLAATIEELRGGPQARLHVRAREEERDTELTRLAGPASRGAETTQRKRTRRTWILAGLAGVVAMAIFVGARLSENPAANTSPRAEVGADAGAGAGTVADAGAGTDAGADAGADAVPAPRGWVHVVVEPWGNVWIDGKYLGRAPVKARLTKGRHVIEAGRELPSKRRVVRVQPGARKEIELTLGRE
jgi:hypothetical protein